MPKRGYTQTDAHRLKISIGNMHPHKKGDENMENEVRLMDGTVCTPAESVEWMDVRKKPIVVNALKMLVDFEVDTLEGTHQGKAGDYLLKGIKGELYPVRKDIFEETYDIIS